MPTSPDRKHSPPPGCGISLTPRSGFALVIALSLMAFVVLLLLTITTFMQVETSNSARTQSQLAAKENALLAMQIALGQLQRYAGPDQRVSARADIQLANTGNPQWTGIWDARPLNPNDPTQTVDSNSNIQQSHATAPSNNAPLVWLVNGSEDPTLTLDPSQPAVAAPDTSNHNVWLLRNLAGAPVDTPIKLQSSAIGTQKGNSGRYAYWVDDIGIKASLTLTPVIAAPTPGSEDQVNQLSAAPTFDNDLLSNWGTIFSQIHNSDAAALAFQSDLDRLLSYEQLEGLIDGSNTITADDLADRFPDISTITSLGVISDSLRGGLRRDLSYALENGSDLSTEPAASEIGLGALIPFGNLDSSGNDRFPDPGPVGQISPTSTWTSSEEISPPTWDLVRSFLSNRPDNSDTMDPVAAPFPLRDTWNIETSDAHAILPIVTMFEFRLGLDISQANYHYSIEPIVVLCNPYNVTLNQADYSVLFEPVSASAPSAGFTITPTTPGQTVSDFEFQPHLGNHQLAFNITDSFAPGEVKIYTPANDTVLSSTADGVINLSPGYTASSVLIDTGVAIDPSLTQSANSRIELQEVSQFHPTIGLALGHASPGSDRPIPSLIARYIETEPKQMDIKYDKDNITQKQTKPRAKMDGTMDTRGLITFRLAMTTPANDYISSGNQPGSQNHGVPAGHSARRSDGGTIGEKTAGMRSLIDSNPRAPIAQRLGGWDSTPTYSFKSFRDADYTAPVAFDLTHAFWGGSIESDGNGTSQVVLFDIPRADQRLVSIGQLAQVNWGTDAKHPSYPLGNSYASIFYEHDAPDLSYALNEALWDRYFFSTLPDSGLNTRPEFLGNPRLSYYDPDDRNADLSFLEGSEAYEKAASRLLIKGAFNINSTSVEAWTAFLGSIPASDYSYQDPTGSSQTDSDTRPYLRLRHVHAEDPFHEQNQLYEWSGYRALDATQIRAIAENVVDGIRERGRPARSLAEFINRDLNFPSDDLRNQKGILQSAIDQVVNQDDPTASGDGLDALSRLPGIVGSNSLSNALVVDSNFVNADNPDAARGKLRATGAPGFLMQNDLITPLAPAMSARSDTFHIRTYGDARHPVTGEVIAKVWCEAYVQRLPDYVGSEASEIHPDALPPTSASAQFGRRFTITQLRWLTEQDI